MTKIRLHARGQTYNHSTLEFSVLDNKGLWKTVVLVASAFSLQTYVFTRKLRAYSTRFRVRITNPAPMTKASVLWLQD